MSVGHEVRREWRPRRVQKSAIAFTACVSALFVTGAVYKFVTGPAGDGIPLLLFAALLDIASFFDSRRARVRINRLRSRHQRVHAKEGASAQDKIRSIRASYREAQLLGVDELPFAAINRSRYTDEQVREIADALDVPVTGPGRPRTLGPLEKVEG